MNFRARSRWAARTASRSLRSCRAIFTARVLLSPVMAATCAASRSVSASLMVRAIVTAHGGKIPEGWQDGWVVTTHHPPAASTLRALQLVAGEGQGADALAREHEERVAHRRRDRRHPGLARAADEVSRLHHVHVDLRRLADPHHRVVVEVGLHDPSLVDGDLTVEGGGQLVDDTPLGLRLDLLRIGGEARVDGADDAMHPRLA